MKLARRPRRPGSWYGVCLVAVLVLLAGAAAQARKDPPAGAGPEGPVLSDPRIQVTPMVASAATNPGDAAEGEAGKPGATDVRMTRPGTFKISVRGADLRSVLQLLSIQGQQNIVATKEVVGTVTADLYDVTFDEALEAVLHSAGFVYRKKGKFVYVYTAEHLAKVLKAEQTPVVRSFRLHYITAKDAKDLITPLLSAEGKASVTPTAAVGIEQSITAAGGNAYATSDVLVVRDYEEHVSKIAQVIAEVDVKPQQVLIEATILRARLNETNALGVDFTALAGIDFEGFGATSDLSSVTTGTLEGAAADGRSAQFRTDFSRAVGEGGMTIGFISNNIAMFVRALESVTDTTVLANPKLLVVNKQRGEVMVGNRNGYLTTTFTETTASQTVQFLETGTRLLVRPFIGKDGYIRLEIHPEDSSGSVEQVGTSALPQETTTEVTSNVLVRDGRTIVIGGLFREDTTAGRAQVPIVGNIPYLGAMFRSTTDTTVREEVIILITPRIIKQENDEAVAEQIKEEVDRIYIGARKGVRWWGRDRLASSYVSKARHYSTIGERAKALWYVDLALSMSPRMVDAIRLKEYLTNRAYWSRQTQDTTARYLVQRMVMQELGKPVEWVTPPDKPLDVDRIDPKVRKALGIQKRPGYPEAGFEPRRIRPSTRPSVQPAGPTPAPPPAPQAPPPAAEPTPGRSSRGPAAKPPPLPTARPDPQALAAAAAELEVKDQPDPTDLDHGGKAPSGPSPQAAWSAGHAQAP